MPCPQLKFLKGYTDKCKSLEFDKSKMTLEHTNCKKNLVQHVIKCCSSVDGVNDVVCRATTQVVKSCFIVFVSVGHFTRPKGAHQHQKTFKTGTFKVISQHFSSPKQTKSSLKQQEEIIGKDKHLDHCQASPKTIIFQSITC